MCKISKSLVALMLMVTAMFAVGCHPVNVSSSGVLDSHEYVDLGLPSGTLWATCNVGSNSPSDCGKYLAWGEIDEKDIYSWDNYKHCTSGNGRVLTKYYDGDNLTVLQPTDDAAKVLWGGGWCMPSDTQWDELINHTNASWTKMNGVYGYLLTADNGNTIFFPAGMSRWQDGYQGFGNWGSYWSNTVYNYKWKAWTCIFDEDELRLAEDYRGDGRLVRPVRN